MQGMIIKGNMYKFIGSTKKHNIQLINTYLSTCYVLRTMLDAGDTKMIDSFCFPEWQILPMTQ